ncbi:MAG TPA: methyltransferase domain-containing protein [Oscillatoriales cyanobacterium M59_W2019_021]|nr:methyltransferase domain-containing protein [Oscillatoriales cyanobacterium M59_W2019_021]
MNLTSKSRDLWLKAISKNPSRLCVGRVGVNQQNNQDGWSNISVETLEINNLQQNAQSFFSIPDSSVDCFLFEKILQYIAPESLLHVIFPEIYRALKPGGYVRISVPDYQSKIFLDRSWKDYKGQPYFDPEGGGRWNAETKSVTQNGHVWFPTYNTLKALIDCSSLRYCEANWLHYHGSNGKPVINSIDYSKGFILRTPDHDRRSNQFNNKMPISIVVDLEKKPSFRLIHIYVLL